MQHNKTYQKKFSDNKLVPAEAKKVFELIDDHSRLSSHMSKSSWMMGGGKMETKVDDKHGQQVGSHIKMSGKVFGIEIYLDEVITHYEPPVKKSWETVGSPKLLVIDHYRMTVEIEQNPKGSILKVAIDYDLPKKNAWLGKLFSGFYAKWCVKQMIKDVDNYFKINT
jgi:hypothetical protein